MSRLANKMLSTVRRRSTAELRGRRGRATDPEWKARRRLLRNREDLTDEQFEKMWNPLLDEGPLGQRLLTAWIAKESLRTLLALARTCADRQQVGHARWKFLTWCADADIPEVVTLATTVDRWWPEIAAFINTGHSNANRNFLITGLFNPEHRGPRHPWRRRERRPDVIPAGIVNFDHASDDHEGVHPHSMPASWLSSTPADCDSKAQAAIHLLDQPGGPGL
ncbi:transposase [Streptomyces sp. NPDC057910]|uniref:transposase n=1 Tax=Streptomyces sp. NPDC057910 TaxID=3346278 RepID=UPI0036EC3E74